MKGGQHVTVSILCESWHANASDKEVKEANTSVKSLQEKVTNRSPNTPIRYNSYTLEERALMGKYAAENGIASAVRYFS